MNDTASTPKVTVVCAWYNRADYLEDTIRSLLNQDLDDYKVVIANDGSTDPRVKLILDSFFDAKLTVIHKENEGFVKTIKQLVENAKSPFVAIQGAGDISYNERLRKQYHFLLDNEHVGAVGCGFDVYSESGGYRRYVTPVIIKTAEDLKKRVPFTHGTIMYRKKAYQAAGGYDARFRYCSDWDLYFRILSVSTISAIEEPLYRKLEFNDGFSFSPVHKFSQSLYKDAATNRSGSRDKLIDSLDSRREKIRPYHPLYLMKSARYSAAFFKKRDFRKSYIWFKYFCTSLFQIYKFFYK